MASNRLREGYSDGIYESDALHEIFKNLEKGKVYGKKVTDARFPYFDRVLYKTHSRGKDYLGWQHFGSSANDFTEDDLCWVLVMIFEMLPTTFLKTYELEEDELNENRKSRRNTLREFRYGLNNEVFADDVHDKFRGEREDLENEIRGYLDPHSNSIIGTAWGDGTGTWYTRANAEWLMYEFRSYIKEHNVYGHVYELVEFPYDIEELRSLRDALAHISVGECLDMDRASDLEATAQEDALIEAFGKKNLNKVWDFFNKNAYDVIDAFDDYGDYYEVNTEFKEDIDQYLNH